MTSPTQPWGIPCANRRANRSRPGNSIATLLAETRIPRYRPTKTPSRRTSALSSPEPSPRTATPRSCSDSLKHSRRSRPPPPRSSSLFDDDDLPSPATTCVSSPIGESGFSFLLELPAQQGLGTIEPRSPSDGVVPELSRSCSSLSFSSDISALSTPAAASKSVRLTRTISPPQRIVLEDASHPLVKAVSMEDWIETSTPCQKPERRRSSATSTGGIAALLSRTTQRASRRASHAVSSLSASLNRLAASIAASQLDASPAGLLPTADCAMSAATCRQSTGLRGCSQLMVRQERIPRPISARSRRSDARPSPRIFDVVEMERAPLSIAELRDVDSDQVDPLPPIELREWSQRRSPTARGACGDGDSGGDDGGSSNTNGAWRPREPRLNADFLRVLVLETNMRRSGKIDPHHGGRARMILAPRTYARARSRLQLACICSGESNVVQAMPAAAAVAVA